MVARFSTLENQLNYQVVAINLASTTGYSFLLRTRKGKKRGGVSLPVLSPISHPFSKTEQRGPYETTTATATESSKSNRFNEQNNKSARASRFLVHFFAVPAQPRRLNDQFLSLLEYGNGKTIDSTIFV